MRTKGRQKISTGIYFVSLCIYTCMVVGGGGGGGGGVGGLSEQPGPGV